ncbi:unnamed protein product [Anisakis simplex]|uniref:AraC family transcriptional regulator n=1 Tax=Anisakis simplex TaxID=6269 RepID=A0A0M3JCY9_ANISI|nr:unnamed protein product [Anisakis simplex]
MNESNFRFYFENREQFTVEQTTALRRITFSSVLCATGDDIRLLPRHSFIVGNQSLIPCELIPVLDLEPWRE